MKLFFNFVVTKLILGAMIFGVYTANAQNIDQVRKENSYDKASPSLMQMPIPMDIELTAAYRQLKKPILASRLLDDMEDEANWSHHGYGRMVFTRQRAKDGAQSIRLISPTLTSKPSSGRPMGTAVLRRAFQQEDWSEYNRISFWVYPNQPNAQIISMGIVLKVEPDPTIKIPYKLENFHYYLLKPDQWNHVIWEIPQIIRHKVEALEFHYRIRGREPGVSHTARFDIDKLELQSVKPDYFEGWEVAPGRIAASQSGYTPEAKKTAISSTITGDTFQLLDVENNEVVLTKQIEEVKTLLGSYQVLDFSDVRKPGMYIIKAEGAASPPIRIKDDIWLESIWKSINFLYAERCGYEIPGIHATCHRDLMVAHDGKQIVINGGWHDAGDLSQGLTNTAEATNVMFSLAELVGEQDTALASRLTEEALWGLDWLLKTRFGDGYRAVWTTMDLWTDGIIGNMDDIVWEAKNSAHANLLAAAAEASAGRILSNKRPELASQALQAAEQDWDFVTEVKDLKTAAFAVNAAIELYKATGKTSYANSAVEYGKIILACQQRKITSWNLPVAGFFYTTPDKKSIVHYSHDSHEQSPIVALSQLCNLFPDHPDWIKWYSAVSLYSEYQKTVSAINEPYFITPASIYDINESKSAAYLKQIQNGFQINKTHFIRRFPIWWSQTYRGNNAVLLSQVKALSTAAVLRRDSSLFNLAQSGMEWVVGKNPFAQSIMLGEGYDNQLLYSPTSGNIVGALPVGIQTYFNRDVPYWASENQSCFKEVWVHPAIRWLSLMNDMSEFSKNYKTNLDEKKQVSNLKFTLSQETMQDGSVSITITTAATETEVFKYTIRVFNLQSKSFDGMIEIDKNKPTTTVWKAKMKSIDEPWVAVIIPNNDLSLRQEIIGSTQSHSVNGHNQLFVWSKEALKRVEAEQEIINTHIPRSEKNVVAEIKDSTHGETLEMILIQSGSFQMGSPINERGSLSEAEVISNVTISQPYFLGEHEVTQAEWGNVMGTNPSQYRGKPDNPVESITWEQAAKFCNVLSRINGYKPVYDEVTWKRKPDADGFRLPTEAEWEYACRAGTTTRFSFGDALDASDAGDSFSKTLDKYLWWRGNNGGSSSYFGSGTKPVGVKLANPWGLKGMHGNVSEWCEDYWVTERDTEKVVDPLGPESGSSHVIRGGYFGSYARYCRSASRYCDAGDHYGDYDFVGFRVLLPATAERIKNIPNIVTK